MLGTDVVLNLSWVSAYRVTTLLSLVEAVAWLRRQSGTRPRTHSTGIADPRILSWWTETDLRTDSLHQSDAPLGVTWCS